MKKNWPYYIVLVLVVVFLYYVSERASRKDIKWEENYTASSRIPFGCYITHDFLEDMMQDGVDDIKKTPYVQLKDEHYTAHNYIFINSEVQPTAPDITELCRFVSEGNSVFIAARNFGFFSDTLDFEVGDGLMYNIQNDSVNTVDAAIQNGSSALDANLVNPKLHLEKNVVFDKSNYASIFYQIDTANTTVLGVNSGGQINFIKVKFGKGEFYLHTIPDAFANYYASGKSTQKYLVRALSYLPDRATFFDEHFKEGRVIENDPRQYILSEPALKLSYLVLVIAGLIAVFFGGKRRQRPVPVVMPPANSTLEFIEQVGVLYYRQGNHIDIIRKKINYFLESVRSRFYAQTIVLDDRFVERIENLSGVPKAQVRTLFSTIDRLRHAGDAQARDLKELEKMIREFNERSKR